MPGERPGGRAALDAELTGFPEEGGKTAATAMPAKRGKEAEPSRKTLGLATQVAGREGEPKQPG